MPNLCDFKIRARGRKCNIRQLVEIANSDPIKGGRYFCGIHDVDGLDVFEHRYENYSEEDVFTAELSGYCSWSVYSCMFSGPNTYMTVDKDQYEDAITVVDVSKIYNLTIEIISSEPGCNFSEHFLIENGDLVRNECEDLLTSEEVEEYRKTEDESIYNERYERHFMFDIA